jgi:undecaprenyl-diphosphatase
MLEHLLQLEQEYFLAINQTHPSWLNPLMYAFSTPWAWAPVFLLPLCLFLKKRTNWRPTLLCTALTVILNLLLTELLIKPYFRRLRPTHHPQFKDRIETLHNYIAGGDYGFISGHTTNAFAFAILTALILRNRYYTPAIFLWATLMAYSRIYLGAHFITDVIPGILLGTLLGLLLYSFYKYVRKKQTLQ